MGRLVKTTPAAQEQQEEKRTVVGTGAHGRLVKTGDVQRTSPAANTAKTPTAQSVYQKALDEAMMKRAAADQKNKERGRKSYNRTHAQEVREITGDKTKKSITPIIKSAAAGYAADMVGAADTLLRAPSGLNYAASQERGEIEASKKNIAAYTEKLKAAKTEEERQQWQTLIDRNKRLIEINSKAAGERVKNYQDATKGARETLQGTYQKLRKTASDNMEKANEGLTPVGKYINSVGVAGAQMVADATLGGGSALGPMFLRVFGGNSQEAAEAADKSGMSAAEQLDAQNRALLYGTASGAVSIATEKISNVAAPFKKAFGGGFLDKAIDGAIAKMNGNTAGRLALSFLSEGGEEVIEDIVQPALQTIYNGKSAGQNYSELDAAEILNDFLVGGTLGLLGSGVEGIQRRSAQIETERAAAETKEAAPSPETTTPPAEAMTQEETAPTAQRPVQQQRTEPAPTQTVERQNTTPAQSPVTPESTQGTGGGHLTPAQPNAAQGAAEGKADALDAGKRVALDKYTTQENVQQVSQKINDGTLAVDAEHNIYRVNENQHIDRRDSASVGERNVNAFQFDHPELHSYYADAAAVLQEEMSFAQKGGELIRRTSREAGDDEYIRTKRGVSERIARLLDDEGVRYDDIDRSLDAIIHNHGQENFAAAKRVELLLDDMLTNGYTDIHGQHIAPNEAYIAAKKAIPGADMSERTHEELPIYDMPEGQNGGIYGRQEENAGGPEPAEGTGQRADAVAAENDLHGGDGGRRPSEPGAGGAGELRSTTAEGRRRNRELTQRRREIAWEQPLTSAAALGVQGGTSDETLHVLPEESWDDELRGFSDWARGKGVKRVTMVTGLLQVETENGPVGVRGIINRESGEMVLRVDGEKRTASEIGKHEVGHLITEEENVRAFMETVRGGADWRGIYEVYERCYEPLTNGYVGMTAEERELYVWEEIMEDAYAGIDSYGQRASRYHEQAVSAIERAAEAAEHPASEPEGLTLRAVDEVKSRGPPEKYSYAGRNAENANLDALHEAERYEMQNVDAETIRQKTGWFRGADGKWRSEVNDSGMKLRFESGLYDYDTELREKNHAWDKLTDRKLTDEQRRDLADYQRSAERGEADEALYEKLTGEFGGDFEKWALTLETIKEAAKSIPNYTTLGKLVDAPELFAAYPNLADIGVTFQTLERGQNGGYNRRFDSIELSRDLKNRPEALLNSLTHEVQHAIQSREGFTPGSNPQYWNRKLEEGYDGRTAKARREGAQLRERYEQMKADDPEFMRSMEELNAMAPTVPRGKIDPNTWEQVEPDPPEWVRFDERRDQLEEKYGDRVWDYFSLRDSIDRNARDSRLPGDLYRDTAGEIEARDAAARRGLTAEERRDRKPDTGDENTVFADGGESYSIRNTKDIPYQKQIDAFYSGDSKTVGRSDDIYIADADNSLSALGIGGKPFFMLKSNLRKSTRIAGNNPSNSAHGISESVIRKLPELIKSPALIVQGDGRISIIPGITVKTEKNNTAPLLIAVNPNGSVDGIDAYEIKSIYGRENFANWLDLRARDSKIIAGDEKKAAALLRDVGKQYPEPVAYAADLTDAILSQSKGDVKSPTLGDEIRRQIMGTEAESLPGEFGYKAERPKDYRLDDNVSDDGGHVKPKTRFSLDEPVEETKTLIAMHNMTEEKLRRTLDIGAWPAPSIAIVKAKDGHTNYGEYSAVFPRETIDPQRSGKNKVYGGDAWTPTRSNARVEYEVNQSRARALEREIDRLSSEFAGGAFRNSSVIGAAGVNEETELSLDDIAERLAKYPAVQAAYLQSKGKSLKPVYKEKKFDSLGNDVLRQYIDRVGMQEVARLYAEMETGGSLDESALNAAREVIVGDWAKRNARLLERRAENRDKLIAVQKNRLEDWRIEKFIRNAETYIEQNGTSGDEVDKEATSAKMYSMIAPSGSWGDVEKTVQQWVRPQLDGLLGKPGIYNGKDPYTENGRKPFKETHWDYTAENIVRAMNNASDRGEGMWGLTGGTLTATSAPQYDSVDAIHADEERLRAESDDVHEKRLRDLDIEIDRVVDDLLRSTKAHSDSEYEERHILEDVLAEAAKGEHSPAAIKRSFAKDGYTIKDGNAKAIMRLFDIAAKIPVGYFEAKPQRVVGFDEALAVVAPDDAPGDLLSEMRDAGMNVVEYRAGDDADRLDKINSIKNVRFSAEDEDGGEWDKELARMPHSVQEAVQRVKDERSKKPNMQEFPNLDAYLSGRSAQQAAEKAERLRDKGKDEFKGTEALEKLGVKIENSAGDYSNVEQLIANDRAAKTIQRETRKAIKRLGATPKEQNFALNIASGLYDEADIPATMNRGKVVELADYYSAEQSMSTDFIRQRRAEINENLQEKMKDLFDEHFDGEFTKEKSGKGIAPESGFALYHRTPQRSMRAIFGWKRGEKINEAIFEPVYVNEQERKRFVNRMHDEVRTFKGKDGKEAALTQRERALAQLSIEGKAVEEMVGKSEIKQQIIHAAENLLDGAEMKDAAQEFGLHGKEERELAQRYADWLETKKELDSGEVDRVKVENAAAKYSGLYNEFYAAINDFLAAHGYEPIGFIKGYAPHFQPEAESGKLERALKAIGVDLGAEVGKLPASIAGLTKEFKPNKRYNPFFQHRNGKSTDYDIQKGFEKYVDYLSDVLYHTDDIMRTRAASKYFRKKYAPDEISAQIQQAEDLKFATAEEKELFLKTNGIIDSSAKMSYQAMNQAMEKYTDSLFDDVTQTTKYGDLVTWLDDYANKLAGKQLFNDRSMEREVGRMSLNVGRKLVSTFARANVAGNLSSALNQTAQLPMIAGELGPKYVAEAIGDIASGKAKGDFADRSDFLTEKRGIRYLTSTKGDKFTAALFWPLERMDYLVSSIAVRGKYRKELAEGKSEKDALRAADRWGRDMMGSRSKGTAPLTFQSKNLISQMVNLFQVEALNSWEHVTQDLFGPGLREMEEKLGKKEASRRLAGIIVGTLLGAFILNRVDEELYGGTPAQFDVLGLLTGFLASGNGLSTNEQLGVWVDDVWQKMTGERLFGTDEDAGNGKFNLAAATEDTIYNVSNDVPYVRNVSGLLGLGDQTLPMPDIYGTAKGIGSAVSDAASGDTEGFGSEIMRQLIGIAGDTLPGGRQLEKTAQGAETMARGGTYKGSGDNERLQYAVNPDFSTVLQAMLFGRNALSEARDFYAANDGGLSASQTRTYQELVDMGADREVVYDAIQKWRKIDKDDSLTDGEREAAQFELVRKLKLTNEQKERLHDDLSRSSRSYAAAQEAQKQGISAETYAKYKDATADLTADKDENGKAINGSKKAKVLDAIDKMQLSKKQKDWLYLDAGYSEKDIGKAPWNS
ncbi:MAG: LPD23 domain-containing protein [Oscillibacter sp.]